MRGGEERSTSPQAPPTLARHFHARTGQTGSPRAGQQERTERHQKLRGLGATRARLSRAETGLFGNPPSPAPRPAAERTSARGRKDRPHRRPGGGIPTTFPLNGKGGPAPNANTAPTTGRVYPRTRPGRPETSAARGAPAQTEERRAGKEYTRVGAGGGAGRREDRRGEESTAASGTNAPDVPTSHVQSPSRPNPRHGPPGAPSATPPARPQGRRGDHPPQGVFKPPRRDALGTWRGRADARKHGANAHVQKRERERGHGGPEEETGGGRAAGRPGQPTPPALPPAPSPPTRAPTRRRPSGHGARGGGEEGQGESGATDRHRPARPSHATPTRGAHAGHRHSRPLHSLARSALARHRPEREACRRVKRTPPHGRSVGRPARARR